MPYIAAAYDGHAEFRRANGRTVLFPMPCILIVDVDAALRGALRDAVAGLGHEACEPPGGAVAPARVEEGDV